MKIAIIGGGSIGLLFSFYLQEYHEVVLYVRNMEQKEKIQSEGLFLRKKNVTFKTSLEVRHISDWGQGDEALSIICVKQYHLSSLLDNSPLPKNHPLLFVQNGMGHLKVLEQLETNSIFVASVEHGSYRLSDNHVFHTGEGLTRIAIFRGNEEELIRSLCDPLQGTFPFHFEKDYYEMLINKLIVNATINPLTSILKVPNGELLENPFYNRIFIELFNEIKEILQLENEELYYQNAVNVCKNTRINRSSMLKDMEEKRPTEVDSILGFLIEEAKKKQIKAPLVQTFYYCIKGSEFEGEGI